MKFKKILISIIVCSFAFLLINVNAFAVDGVNGGYVPRENDIGTYVSALGNSNNPYYIDNISKYANLSKFSLRDIIPENVIVRNQGSENSCWAFTTLACLETNLALKNKRAGKEAKVYDFSEQYMVSSSFYNNYLNGLTNNRGLNFKPYEGGNFETRAIGNITNGYGVVNEEDYPYLNTEAPVDLNGLKNKKIVADVLDTITFSNPKNNDERISLIKKIKEHIVENGGVYTAIKAPDIGNFKFNPFNGALYHNNEEYPNHAVTIIGWDDNYSKDNFVSKPERDGAWIVKNSYGTEMIQELSSLKKFVFTYNKENFNSEGIFSENQISDEQLINSLNDAYYEKFGKRPIKLLRGSDGKKYCSMNFGTEGYIYVSYEDNTLRDYSGIVRAVEGKDYDNLYQNYYYYNDFLQTINGVNTAFIAEQYTANLEEEYITKLSIYVSNDSEYEFFANITDDEININKFVKLQLENGDTKIKLQTGYHTVYLRSPLKLNSKKFAIGAKVFGENGLRIGTANRVKKSVSWYDYSQPTGKSYLGSVDGDNVTFSKVEDYDFTLKAYTRLHGASNQNLPSDGITEKKREITRIEVKNLPNKREYVQNKESLNLYGGDIKVYYNDGTSMVISMTDPSVIITGFNNKALGNNLLTLEYGNQTTNFSVLIKEDKLYDDTIYASDDERIKNKNSIDDAKFDIFNQGSNKIIKIKNIKPYISNSNYEFSIIMKDSKNNVSATLINKNNIEKVKFYSSDLKKDNDDSYYYEYVINDNDIMNSEILKKSEYLIVYLKEYVNGVENNKLGKLELSIEKNVKDTGINAKGNKENQNIVDNTMAKGRLPQTGEKNWIFGIMFALFSICIAYKVYTNKIK
ncbi:MAG: C1 family peptidase [Clostridiales bacterium]|nr:C1 family peptidase [Clostridiales bacterium]